MNPVPAKPKIYHITHVDNLPSIIAAGAIWSDAERITQGLGCALVGLPEIKRRRLEELPVPCQPGTTVGQYVPFFFCPRSIMLYILHCANNPELTYRGGQGPVIHLQADVHKTVEWATGGRRQWAFSTSNAGARYAQFFATLDDLGQVSWAAVAATDFRSPEVKDGKQAEFLLFQSFPWSLVERIGVENAAVLKQVHAAVLASTHKPTVGIERGWYY